MSQIGEARALEVVYGLFLEAGSLYAIQITTNDLFNLPKKMIGTIFQPYQIFNLKFSIFTCF
jgi:hypothetical protein